jgi:hypothetical protein|tara:strand:+ start:1856 stop:2050 length:195 start_codon:yes stop_codon:yes gene_type:complete
MTVDNTKYNVLFRAPALPYPPTEYSQGAFDQFNNVLRLYFKQLDIAIRNANTADQAEAAAWFFK